MVLFFDLCNYTDPNAKAIGCDNQDYRLVGDWSDLSTTARATKDAFIKGMNELRLALSAEPGLSGCTGYTTAWQTISGMGLDSRYSNFWNLANNQMDVTPQIYYDYTQLINEVMCATNEIFYYFSGQEITTYWSYPEEWKKNYWGIGCCPLIKCGDDCIDLSGKLTTDLVQVDSVEEFTNVISSELIDVKNRQTISSYATLRMLYDRYNFNSLDFSSYKSSQYDYFDMDNFGQAVGNYWIDLIEQVVPATTIWDSTYVYRNTVFDEQKFEYKMGSTFTCIDGPCNLNNIDYLNDCMGSIIEEFYTDECPPPTSLATVTSTYYYGDE
jgi:hypothetical protein